MGTSMAPTEIEKQILCIESWIKNGFLVRIFNTESEIDTLKEYICSPGIEFVSIKRDAYEVAGKRLPYLQDILDAVADETEQICGYFNSDILINSVEDGLLDYIREEALNSIIILHRNEINAKEDIDNLNFDINFDGIDAFFADKKNVCNLFDDEAYVQTTWDSFLIGYCRRRNISLKTLLNPICFHFRHKLRWDYARVEKSYNMLAKKWFKDSEDSRRQLFYEKYETLYSYADDKVYLSNIESKVVYVVDKVNNDIISAIKSQGISNYDVVSSEKGRYFDAEGIVIHIPQGVLLRKVFTKWVLYIMNNFDIYELIIGSFFVSDIDGRIIYNQLNRSIQQLKQLNKEDVFCIRIVNSKKAHKNKTAKLMYPICYRNVSVDATYIDVIPQAEKTYLFPAGYRAGEWYAVNRFCLKNDICGFVDNDEKKIGKKMAERDIYTFEVLTRNPETKLVIVCTKYYLKEIHEQLRENGIKYLDGDMIMLVNNDSIFSFNQKEYIESLNEPVLEK